MRAAILFSTLFATLVVADPNPAYVCSFCILGLGLVEEVSFQLHLLPYLQSKCTTDSCKTAAEHFVLKLEGKAVPEEICREVEMCNDECVAFDTWPVNPLPAAPPEWPIERKLLENVDYSEVKQIFVDLLKPLSDAKLSFWEVIVYGLAAIAGKELPFEVRAKINNKLMGVGSPIPDCQNVSCHIYNFVEYHTPLQDADNDYFSTSMTRRFRGTDWRGTDCDDTKSDIYPGRKSSSYDSSVDHNCNGIYGGNETGTYEELFCSNYKQKGIIILGDSATAHFHIPPQWVTADGWNMDQLLEDAENELDQPGCSWGTGHLKPEECPYQYDVPEATGVTSLYTKLRERNRCNHNDYQNIGVNGADSADGAEFATAMGRQFQDLDQPALVWLAMIGNDVCNGHPGFDHMTKPDDFYEHSVNTLQTLDTILPKGSHVVALALFDGELLYATMHAQQHPVGTSYQGIYDFMNCEEENPCWGWLNSDRATRWNTTKISNSLNDQYQKIADTMTFNNFEFIFYNPHWATIFSDYAKAGNDLKNLIEPVDGFHPSQAGNALFAVKFYEWLETEHPEALGDINPYNAEIDAMFFSS